MRTAGLGESSAETNGVDHALELTRGTSVASGDAEVTTMTLAHRILAAATCIGALVVWAGGGCKRKPVDGGGVTERIYEQGATDGESVGTTTITGANIGALSSETATERIVVARCARETACNNIGADKRFASPELCAREIRKNVGADLAPSKCPRGIDVDAVDKCTDAIRTESCNDSVDTIYRLAVCRASAMCLETER